MIDYQKQIKFEKEMENSKYHIWPIQVTTSKIIKAIVNEQGFGRNRRLLQRQASPQMKGKTKHNQKELSLDKTLGWVRIRRARAF